jgi:hypothetical protein
VSDDEQFDGHGFSSEPLTHAELARIRNMLRDVSRIWPGLNDAATVVRAFTVFAQIIKIGGPVSLAALGLGAFMRTQGYI